MLVEALTALVIMAIVATGIVNMVVSSQSITTVSKERTIAEQGVSNQIERIRAMDYNVVGTTTGNPSGNLLGSVAFNGLNGESIGVPATMTTTVTFASANVPGSALTGADEKKIVVAITRNRDGKVLSQATTYVAPKLQASQTTGTVQATVTDIGNNQSQSGTVLENVRVTLTPPSGLVPAVPSGPESDTTDASGTVSFAGLTPTSGDGTQLYTVGIASADMPSLYYAQPVAGFDLTPTQILPESIQIYQPVTIDISLVKPDGTPWVGTAKIVLTAGSGGTQYTFNNVAFTAAGTAYPITSQGTSGAPLLPNIDYFITVTATGYNTVTDDDVVPAAGVYPATSAALLTGTFNETMTPTPTGTLDITATRINSSTHAPFACHSGASVKVYDPNNNVIATGTTSTSSPYDVQLQVPTGTTYSVSTTGGSGRTGTTTGVNPVANPNKTPVAVALSGSSTSGTTC